MTKQSDAIENDIDIACLKSAGLDAAAVDAWVRARPGEVSGFARDAKPFSAFFRTSKELLARLPAKARRNEAETAAAALITQEARHARTRFLSAHGAELYDAVTDLRSRFLNLTELLADAAEAVPGLVPTAEELATDQSLPLAEKSGVEIDQGLLLSAVLASKTQGQHLCHAMLLPRPEALDLVPKLARDGMIDLGGAKIERQGQASIVTMQNPRHLNAEDDTTLGAMATCVDLALLDPATSVGVLRGGVVEHPKFRGRRIFGAGINLTHLYQGRIPYLWYLERDLGYVHKIYRGLASPEARPDDVHGETREKPFISAVERFAIGGHCQLLLVSDYILAESDAYLTLPARKEGIIPGFANLRMPRFVGDRITRQAIQYERRIDCAKPDGRMICDEIVETEPMDDAIARVVEGLSNSGVVSAAANRRAIRIGQETLDMFRSYAAVYAREQAGCHFSPALIRNLERFWNERSR